MISYPRFFWDKFGPSSFLCLLTQFLLKCNFSNKITFRFFHLKWHKVVQDYIREYMFLVAGKDFLWSRKSQSLSCFFHERFFVFWDRTVVKTERSKVLAVQIKENGKSLKEKAPSESFYTEDKDFQLLGYIISASDTSWPQPKV